MTREELLEHIEFYLMDLLDEGHFVTTEPYGDQVATANCLRGVPEVKILNKLEELGVLKELK